MNQRQPPAYQYQFAHYLQHPQQMANHQNAQSQRRSQQQPRPRVSQNELVDVQQRLVNFRIGGLPSTQQNQQVRVNFPVQNYDQRTVQISGLQSQQSELPYQSSLVNEPHPTPTIRVSRASRGANNVSYISQGGNHTTPEITRPENTAIYATPVDLTHSESQRSNLGGVSQVIVQFPEAFFLQQDHQQQHPVSWNMINNRNGHSEDQQSLESVDETTFQIRPNTPIQNGQTSSNTQGQATEDFQGIIVQRVRLPSRNIDQLRSILQHRHNNTVQLEQQLNSSQDQQHFNITPRTLQNIQLSQAAYQRPRIVPPPTADFTSVTVLSPRNVPSPMPAHYSEQYSEHHLFEEEKVPPAIQQQPNLSNSSFTLTQLSSNTVASSQAQVPSTLNHTEYTNNGRINIQQHPVDQQMLLTQRPPPPSPLRSMSNLYVIQQQSDEQQPQQAVNYNLDLSLSSSETNNQMLLYDDYQWTRVDENTRALLKKQKVAGMENQILLLQQQNQELIEILTEHAKHCHSLRNDQRLQDFLDAQD